METIGKQELWSFAGTSTRAKMVKSNVPIRESLGYPVEDYLDLATKVAELQYRNRDYVLLFRGQKKDHKNLKGLTSLKPELFRPKRGNLKPPDGTELERRFDKLRTAERSLITHPRIAELVPDMDRIRRQRVLRWAILQHYDICATPLLDVTNSLRIAASFASLGSDKESFLYVLGVPYLSGAVTASAEAGVQIVRLSSVCPPKAVRPHIQEGYLLGEYPEVSDYKQKEEYAHFEIDFGRRLIAKFRFTPTRLWTDKIFPKFEHEALYPDQTDRFQDITSEIANSLK